MSARSAWIFVVGAALAAGCSAPPATEGRPRARAGANAPLALPPLRRATLEAESYAVGARDILSVRITSLERARELTTLNVEVDASGTISVPFAGKLSVQGATVEQVRAAIVESLSKNVLVDPQVTVLVREYRSRPIAVLGAVERGGVFYLQKNEISLVEALSLAGGLSQRAGTRAVVLATKDGVTVSQTEVDLVALLLENDERYDVPVTARTTVNVLPAEDFYVTGYVPHPGNFPFRRPITVTQAVALAGGVDERVGSPSAVTITRATERGMESVKVDLVDIAAGEAPDLAVAPGDTIQVSRTLLKTIQTMFETIVGHFGFGVGYNLQ